MKKLLLVLALAACHKGHNWDTSGGEQDGMIVHEYWNHGDKAPSWVLRLDLSKTQINAANDLWQNDDVTFQLGGANGEVDTKLHLGVGDDSFAIDGKSYAASAGRLITIPVDPDGNLGAPAQSSLDGYKPI